LKELQCYKGFVVTGVVDPGDPSAPPSRPKICPPNPQKNAKSQRAGTEVWGRAGVKGEELRELGSNLKTFDISRPALARLVAVVRNNLVPFVGRRASDKGNDRFGIAHVKDFVRHTGFDVDEIDRFILDYLLKFGAEFLAYFS